MLADDRAAGFLRVLRVKIYINAVCLVIDKRNYFDPSRAAQIRLILCCFPSPRKLQARPCAMRISSLDNGGCNKRETRKTARFGIHGIAGIRSVTLPQPSLPFFPSSRRRSRFDSAAPARIRSRELRTLKFLTSRKCERRCHASRVPRVLARNARSREDQRLRPGTGNAQGGNPRHSNCVS